MELTSEALNELSMPDLLRAATGFMGLLETLNHIDGLDPKNLAAANLKAGVDMRALKRLDEDLQFVARELDGKGLITPLHGEKVRQAKRNLKQVILGVQRICKQSASRMLPDASLILKIKLLTSRSHPNNPAVGACQFHFTVVAVFGLAEKTPTYQQML